MPTGQRNPQNEALINYILDRTILEPLRETKKFVKQSKGDTLPENTESLG